MSNASLKEQLQAVASQLEVPTAGSKRLLDASNQPSRHVTANKKVEVQASQQKPKSYDFKPKKPKPKWLDYVQYGVELLKVYFPAGFKPANEVQPLKKGIKQDLIKRLSTIDSIVTEDKACMVKSLAYYVNTTAYHKSVVEGAMRIDLDGEAAGQVSAEEAKYSYERYQAKLQNKSNSNKEGVT